MANSVTEEEIAHKVDDLRLDLNSFMPYQLRRTYAVVSDLLLQIYEGEFGLSASEWRVLAILVRDEEATNREIVVNATIDKVAVSRAISRLSDKGLVDRKPNPEDGRSELLLPSEAGTRLYKDVSPHLIGLEKELLGTLSQTERRQLNAILKKIEASGQRLAANET